jgi:alkylhydroperoxidase/carboxymuconolactone decarboxylase family protein YurZ
MLPEKQQKAFGDFYDTVRHNDILEPKTTLLLHLGAAMALGCSPCMEYYLGQAEKEGISAEEIGAVQGVVMAVGAGRVNAQLREVERKRSGRDRNSGQQAL